MRKENLSGQEQTPGFCHGFPHRELRPSLPDLGGFASSQRKSLTKFRIMAGIMIAKKEKMGRGFCSKWEEEPPASRRDLCVGELECKVKDNFSADYEEIH